MAFLGSLTSFAKSRSRIPIIKEPPSAISIGDVSEAWLGIYLSIEVANFIEAFIKANPAKRMGGILLGYVSKKVNRPFILITGVVEAPDNLDIHSNVHFTTADWKYMNSRWEKEYPNSQLLGWFQSNPTGDLKITGYDRFTHYRFFNKEWQICLSVDPKANISNFFCWYEGQLLPQDAFYLWDPKKDPLVFDSLTSQTKTTPKGISLSPWITGLTKFSSRSVSIIVVMLLLCSLPFFSTTLPGIGHTFTETKKEVESLKVLLQQAQDELASIETQIEDLIEFYTLLKENQSHIDNETVISSVQEPEYRSDSPSGFHTYQVVPGDTLWEISKHLLGDPRAYHRIVESNSISDPDIIIPGMSLLVPRITSQ